MKTLWATMLAAALAYCTPAAAVETSFFGKPVLCGTAEKNTAMWQQIKDDGMAPLLGFAGNSFLDDGTKFNASFFVMYNPEEQIITIVEVQENGFQCLIAGGSGDVRFDPDELKELIGWDDLN